MLAALLIKQELLRLTCIRANHFKPPIFSALQQAVSWNIKLNIDRAFGCSPFKVGDAISRNKGLSSSALHHFICILHLRQLIRSHPPSYTSHADVVDCLGFAKF